MLKVKDGEISKRFGGYEIRELRKIGIDKNTLNSYLARIGTAKNVTAESSLKDLAENFKFKDFSQSAVIYSEDDLYRLNRKTLANYNFQEIKERAENFGFVDLSEEMFEIIKDNLDLITDVEKWYNAIINPQIVELNNDDCEFLSLCLNEISSELSDSFYEDWLSRIKQKSNRSGRSLFNPIRLALTGTDYGPELKKIIPFIGLEEVQKRIIRYVK